MRRREFLASGIALAGAAHLGMRPARLLAAAPQAGPGFCDPKQAMQAPRETLLYVVALYVGTGIEKPDYLATVDVDPSSSSYGKVIHRLPMGYVGDELHHFGWNACSSCHGNANAVRRFLILPGLRSSRIYIVDAADPRAPKMHKVIQPETVMRQNLSAPHTVHCLADGQIMISMLGDAQGNAPGGFLLLNQNFDVVGRWEHDASRMRYNYDFWYQPRINAMVSSEWAAPNTFISGFNPGDVASGNYGRRLHFWDWKGRTILKSIDLGPEGNIPLEVRFHHNPDSSHGFVGAALSSTIWHWYRPAADFEVQKIISVDPFISPDSPMPVPGLITDLVLSMDDRFLYFSNWLQGDVRQYDVSDPTNPQMTGQVWLGGLIGRAGEIRGRRLIGGPQMLQLSLDGRRLYVTNSLFSSWDNQFYPDMARSGSLLLQIDCDPHRGGMRLNDRFVVDFGKEPEGPARAHEMRYPGGDCTSDIFV